MLSKETIDALLTLLAAVLASGGLWMYATERLKISNSKREEAHIAKISLSQQSRISEGLVIKLLLGIAHDRISWLGMSYIKKGWITKEEYENLHDYLFLPYREMGGNGSIARIMAEIEKLPIVPQFQGTSNVPTLVQPQSTKES